MGRFDPLFEAAQQLCGRTLRDAISTVNRLQVRRQLVGLFKTAGLRC
jgi:hypothetical protein